MKVAELWMHPVKSMIGSRVLDAQVSSTGVVGDRSWAVRDEQLGGIRGAKRIGGLMKLAARYAPGAPLGGPVDIVMPDGTATSSAHADVNDRLSAALAHQVTLWPLLPSDELDHYRRGPNATDDFMAELRGVFGRDEDEPLPDLSIFPPWILEFESEPGTYLDAFPLMLMSSSALRSMQHALPDSAIDVRRFRPNAVIDTGDAEGHPEFDWVGQRAQFGEAVIEFGALCPRCVMVTREVDVDVPADRSVLRHIVRELDQNVGVYATVVQPGRVAEGDPFSLL